MSLGKRIRAIQGGTAASKTISILLYLIHLAQGDKKPTLTSVVSETLPHLKKGAIRDFIHILETHNFFKENQWNRTDFTYTFDSGSKIEFFSADQPGKVRGPRRDRLFINEANNISYEIFDQLEIRTKRFIFMDWNPTNEFWFYDKIKNRNDVDHIVLTYKDNEGLDKRIVESIEQHKLNKSWWKVYGEGQLGDVEGKIYKDWQIIDEVEYHARLERRGLDFGYSNDPTGIVAIYYLNGGYILDEECYQKGMLNKPIADLILNSPHFQTLVIGDSAEPKSIDEIKLHGVNIVGAEKGADSVRNGIALVQDQRISVTKRSVNLIKEYRNYMWKTDRDGNIINEPDHEYSHLMDAVRYGLSSIIKKPAFVMPKQSQPMGGYYPTIGL